MFVSLEPSFGWLSKICTSSPVAEQAELFKSDESIFDPEDISKSPDFFLPLKQVLVNLKQQIPSKEHNIFYIHHYPCAQTLFKASLA